MPSAHAFPSSSERARVSAPPLACGAASQPSCGACLRTPPHPAVFPVALQGNATLRVSRYTPVASCGATPAPASCIQCGGAAYRVQNATAAFQYGAFQQPVGASRVAFQGSLAAATGYRATFSWESTFPRNLMGNGSDPNVTAWIAYLPGPQGDTGRTVVDTLPTYYAVSSDASPDGEARARGQCAASGRATCLPGTAPAANRPVTAAAALQASLCPRA